MKKSPITWIAWILVLIGGINWGLIGAFNFDLVALIFNVSWLIRTVQILVGISAIYLAFMSKSE
ncbi:DUF378 domain-containing protein [archaeon]|jgi:uncharacterized protein|nr:DUF378 domain-containing protein [archaeon]